jgi:hypothetical protein
MARWDIFQRETRRQGEVQPQPQRSRQSQTGASMSVGRGGSDNAASNEPDKQQRPQPDSIRHSADRLRRDVERPRGYTLRPRENRALTDIGTFRTVDVKDLAQYAYGGDVRAMNYDLGELRVHGLVQEKLVPRAHREPRRVVALTKKGHRTLRKASGLRKGQILYHDFVKPREIEHDADLYKVYQRAAEEIRARGGRPVRVRLDFEMKGAIHRERSATKSLPDEDRTKRIAAFAKEHNLTINAGRIHVPDVQIEYETREGQLERTNLELVSENYRTEGIRSKAESGFALYGRGGDTSRIRRALGDTHTVERILSI